MKNFCLSSPKIYLRYLNIKRNFFLRVFFKIHAYKHNIYRGQFRILLHRYLKIKTKEHSTSTLALNTTFFKYAKDTNFLAA